MSNINNINVDVQSLFGVQAAEAYSKNMQNRRGTRTKARTMSMTHAASFAKLPNIHNSMSISEVISFEETNMRLAESEQRLIDNFWGLDKEAKDSKKESFLMYQEDILSCHNEAVWKKEKLFEMWGNEEKRKAEEDELISAVREDKARYEYMKMLHSTMTSGDIIRFQWPTRDSINNDGEVNISNALNSPEDLNKGEGSILGFDLHEVPMTSIVHLEGLQKSRMISIGSNKYAIDPQKTFSIAELTLTSLFAKQTSKSIAHYRQQTVMLQDNNEGRNSKTNSSSIASLNKQNKYFVNCSEFLSECGSKYIAGVYHMRFVFIQYNDVQYVIYLIFRFQSSHHA
jgi:hypothetical protein